MYLVVGFNRLGYLRFLACESLPVTTLFWRVTTNTKNDSVTNLNNKHNTDNKVRINDTNKSEHKLNSDTSSVAALFSQLVSSVRVCVCVYVCVRVISPIICVIFFVNLRVCFVIVMIIIVSCNQVSLFIPVITLISMCIIYPNQQFNPPISYFIELGKQFLMQQERDAQPVLVNGLCDSLCVKEST